MLLLVWKLSDWSTCQGECQEGKKYRNYICQVPECFQPRPQGEELACDPYDTPGEYLILIDTLGKPCLITLNMCFTMTSRVKENIQTVILIMAESGVAKWL